MIGIIGAMPDEVEFLLEKLTEKTEKKYSGTAYVSGKFGGEEIVVAKCGIGKVNAALCAQTMILLYKPAIILNTGVAGSVSESAKIGDVVIAGKIVQHDYDLSPIGFEPGLVQEIGMVHIPCTSAVTRRLESAAKQFGNFHVGTIATGDQFISSADAKTALAKNFGAIACEMEGAAIAHVCTLAGVDFGIVRTISDNANDSSPKDFNEFLREAARKSVEIISGFLTQSPKST